MGTLILSATAVLVVLGFSNELLWLAAVGLLHLYIRHGRTRGGSAESSPSSGGAAQPASYRAYRERRDQQAKWERRYRRERPFEARRQERQRNGR
ncbi:hypothetical protein [Streptomyces heilongjiangensis]|uniref:Uncharacterized protein n=1 Tax=Streptomyces heilongjiangensis TaxID=945052 RepID=A0ABW1B3H6_9ACTN|nr:hypothetical protein [Streptomyces heilongjiangensis]MDC2945921.1 hypothetical protein [Streptomyces heilongjiangensis]